jgi:Ca2+-binding EF-hand superfamily protein
VSKVDNSHNFMNFPATRKLRDNELNAVINALNTDGNKTISRDELTVGQRDLFYKLDTTPDGRLSTDEVKAGFQQDLFSISIGNRQAAVDVLLKLDNDQNGYLAANELAMNDKMLNQLDGYGSNKYSHKNGEWVTDSKGKMRLTGAARKDGFISISEMANALADGILQVGQRFTIPSRVHND